MFFGSTADVKRHPYLDRTVDGPLDELLGGLAAIALEGRKGVEKTRTTRRRAAAFFDLSDPAMLELVKGRSEPARVGPAAGRIVRLRMRPTVSLAVFLTGARPPIGGTCSLRLEDYAREVVAGGSRPSGNSPGR